MTNFSFNSATAENLEQVDEDHDDVEVQDQRTNDVVVQGELVALAAQHKLSVHDEVDTEQEDTKSRDHHLEDMAVEEDPEEAEEEESHSGHEDDTPLRSEIGLGRAGVGGACAGDSHGADSCANDWPTVLEVVRAILSVFVAHLLVRVEHADVGN